MSFVNLIAKCELHKFFIANTNFYILNRADNIYLDLLPFPEVIKRKILYFCNKKLSIVTYSPYGFLKHFKNLFNRIWMRERKQLFTHSQNEIGAVPNVVWKISFYSPIKTHCFTRIGKNKNSASVEL